MSVPRLRFPVHFLLLTGLGGLPGCSDTGTQSSAVDSTYPHSRIITGVSFNWSTHLRYAYGSDIWPITWTDDDNQYTG